MSKIHVSHLAPISAIWEELKAEIEKQQPHRSHDFYMEWNRDSPTPYFRDGELSIGRNERGLWEAWLDGRRVHFPNPRLLDAPLEEAVRVAYEELGKHYQQQINYYQELLDDLSGQEK